MSRCDSCIYRGDLHTGTESRIGCAYIMHTGASRVKDAYKRLGVDHITDEVRKALRPANCRQYKKGPKKILNERKIMLPGSVPNEKRPPAWRIKMDRERAGELYRAGKTDREIAEKLGVSPSTVKGWRRKIGLPANLAAQKKTYCPEVQQMYKQGKSDKEIAEQLGLSSGYVCKWRQRRGLKPNPDASKQEAQRIREERLALFEQGLTDRQIAERQGISKVTVYRWRQRMGLTANREPEPSNERKAAALEAWRAGATDRELGEVLGVDLHAAACWRLRQGMKVNPDPAHRHGLLDPPWHAEALRLHGEGKTDREIAQAVGRKRAVIGNWRRKRGLKLNKDYLGPRRKDDGHV